MESAAPIIACEIEMLNAIAGNVDRQYLTGTVEDGTGQRGAPCRLDALAFVNADLQLSQRTRAIDGRLGSDSPIRSTPQLSWKGLLVRVKLACGSTGRRKIDSMPSTNAVLGAALVRPS
jgi:hypothetical protein